MDKNLLGELAELINEEIQKEFEVHLTGNLAKEVIIQETETGFTVEIPATKYDLSKFYNEGVVVHTSGSYAQELDEKGSFWDNHQGYVNRVINNAIQRWMHENNLKVNIK